MVRQTEISDLPRDVLEKIVAYLPTKEAGRTSILSTNWRRTWRSIRALVICYANTKPVQTIKWVDEMFALREGPIDKFDLSIIESFPYAMRQYCFDAFDRWIRYLSRTEIRELSLDLHYWDYKIHSSLFSHSSLRSLCIKNCGIKFPVEQQELKLVHTLELHDVKICGHDVEMLISCCPMLENLTLDRCMYYGDNPRICAPNLKKIHMGDWCHFLQLRAPKLLHLCIQFNCMTEDLERTQGKLAVIDLNKFFVGLPNLEKLELRNRFLSEFYDAEFATGKFLLQNLKELWLDFRYFIEEEVKFVSPLFHNAPNLQVLHLEVGWWLWRDEKIWKSMKAQDFSLQSIQIMSISEYEGFYCPHLTLLPFIKFVLGSASKLQKLIFRKFKHDCDERPTLCLKKIVLSLKVRTNAQIIFEETV